MYTVAAVHRSLLGGCQSRAELMHCLACATLSEAQGSVESREACITPSEVDKVHQWPIYSTVQYQASSPPANTQWQHERVFVWVSVMPIKTKLPCSFKNFLSREEVRQMVNPNTTPTPTATPPTFANQFSKLRRHQTGDNVWNLEGHHFAERKLKVSWLGESISH